MVYLFSVLFGVEYTNFLFSISILLPLILTPLTIAVIIRLTKHLKYIKIYLQDEIEKNKKKDIMLFEQARFALMGEMMANISHQWKQPLNTIGLATVDARMSKCDETNLEKNFDIIEDNISHLAITINDFMSFFDKRNNLEIRNIDNIVKEIKSIINTHIANKDIKLEIDIQESAKDVKLASSISQVILNILNNSIDAFNEEIKNKKISLIFRVKNYALEIVCIDNAKGIEAEIEDKIFDPYFTTKDKSQGTGIGLYMSKQIVQKLFSGTIEANSQIDTKKECKNKTCFYITLPCSDQCVLKENKK
ncbi:MAG: HAMP domain-containing histidine kinase [Sulfurimonas sp.]|nr:HAMP domain-containing histidine kinase [Sulfurimonas sp.]